MHTEEGPVPAVLSKFVRDDICLKLLVYCPHCGHEEWYSVRDINKADTCDSCKKRLLITRPTSNDVEDRRSSPAAVASDTEPCLYCRQPKPKSAVVCPHCTRDIFGRSGTPYGDYNNFIR